MFIGHFGIAMAAKKAAPRTSLGTLILAAQFLDLLWPIFLLAGVEHAKVVPGITKLSPLDFTDYPISHSLGMTVVWAGLVARIYYGVRRYARGAWVIAVLLLSHWLLDFVVHRPDLPLLPGGAIRVGLGLWNHWAAAVLVEVLVFGGGAWIYVRTTRASDNIGQYAFAALAAFLFLGWVATLFSGPPPSIRALAWGGITMGLTLPWAWWTDRHRRVIA